MKITLEERKRIHAEGATLVGRGKDDQLVIGVKEKGQIEAMAQAYPDAEIRYTGEIRALWPDPGDPKLVPPEERWKPWRPAPGGVSLGHHKITAGTLGGVTPDLLILSNNHVMANCNDCVKDDPILQPGPYDGGKLEHQIAKLHSWVPIQFYQQDGNGDDCPFQRAYVRVGNFVAKTLGSKKRIKGYSLDIPINYVDAALAEPLSGSLVSKNILDIGIPLWVRDPYLAVDIPVQSSGRTTGLTRGKITALEASVQVGYPGNRYALFTDQIITDPILQAGDSGSLLVGLDLVVLGLGFAGSSEISIHNMIRWVFELFSLAV